MKKTNLLYWIFTGLFAAMMLLSAIPNIMVTQQWVDIFTQLGYPKYLIPYVGAAKLLGVIAILVPGYPRLKEWAYAGLFFDIVTAMYSAIASGGPVLPSLSLLIWVAVGALSYIYYHKRLKLATGK